MAALFSTGALAITVLAMVTRPADLPRPSATAVVWTAAPAASMATATSTPQPPPTPEEPTGTPPPPPPGEVRAGAYVQVIGTGDAGFLNLRAEPNLDSAVNYLALEREVFQVQAGPSEASGFVWWYLVDPATNSRFGWAVQNYLQVVQGP